MGVRSNSFSAVQVFTDCQTNAVHPAIHIHKKRSWSRRSQLEQLLHENYLTSGGDENVKCFFREQGFQTGISNVIKVGLRSSIRATHKLESSQSVCLEYLTIFTDSTYTTGT